MKVATSEPISGDFILAREAESPILRFSNGKSEIPVESVLATEVKKGYSFGRVKRLIEKIDVMDNNSSVEKDVKREVVRGDLQVEAEISEENLNQLVALLNKYRDCIALSPKEIGCTSMEVMDNC